MVTYSIAIIIVGAVAIIGVLCFIGSLANAANRAATNRETFWQVVTSIIILLIAYTIARTFGL